ncbi:dTDP-4-dehydrorhamnose 3,5-epimerase [Patescibacteria group bacterium]
MIFEETYIKGLYKIELEKRGDDRGFFARFFCKDEYAELGLENEVLQINNSLTGEKQTLRGMHYQLPPKAEVRIVRCLKGALFDMALDLRPGSETYGKSFGIELNDENRTMMYVPKGFAHGFLTLQDNTEMMYLVTESYGPEYERVIRYNDSNFDMEWPVEPLHLSDKDKEAKDFEKEYHLDGMENL